VVVADRGYSRRPQAAWVLSCQADLVVRLAVTSFPLEDEQAAPFDVFTWLQAKAPGCYEQPVSFTHQQQRYQVRLLAQALSPEEAERARAKVQRKASKQQRAIQEETLFLAGWMLVVTSLPASHWSAAQVLSLYRARWQIELVIKRMKQVLKLAQLRGKTAQSNEASLFVCLLAWALQQEQVDEARQIIGQAIAELGESQRVPITVTISSWGLHVLSIQSLRLCVQGYWTPARLRQCWPRLRRFVCSRRKRRRHQETTIRAMLCQQFGLDVALFFNCSSA
jgi:hypothetical protein